MYSAYDDNVLEALADRDLRSPWLQSSGLYHGADAGLDYGFAVTGRRVGLRGQALGQIRYYHHQDRARMLAAASGDVSFNVKLTESLTFDARETVAYEPSYSPGLFPQLDETNGHDIALTDTGDFDLFELPALRTATTLSVTQRFGRYISLYGLYNLRSVDIEESAAAEPALPTRFRDYRTHSGTASLQYQRPFTRYASLVLGYGLRVSDQRSQTGEPQKLHIIDAGVNYGRALSFSRRTSLNFGTGSAIAVNDRLDVPESERRTQAQLTGRVSIAHEMGRTWTANVGYTRGFRNQQGFDQLYFSDAVSAGLDGLITRKLSFSSSAAWANSTLEYTGAAGQRGYSASAQAQYALSRFGAIYVRYVYYHYKYGEDVRLDPRFPRRLDRQGVRVGFSTFIPVIR